MKIIGHRGARRESPENTIGGFLYAKTSGVRNFELDLHLTKNDCPVVIHDETMDRTTLQAGHVCDIPSDRLKSYNAAATEQWTYEYVPLFRDCMPVLNTCDSIQLEIKTSGPNQQTVMMKELNKLLALDTKQCYNITSKDELAVKFAKSIVPHIPRGIVCDDRDPLECLDIAIKLDCKLFVCEYTLISQAIIEQVNRAGLEVHVYTVNDEERIQRFKEWGVDGVITDYPVKFLKYED